MAVFYRCDGCSEETQDPKELGTVTIPHLDYHQQRFTNENDGYSKEYCIRCVRAIKSLIDSLNDEAEENHETK